MAGNGTGEPEEVPSGEAAPAPKAVLYSVLLQGAGKERPLPVGIMAVNEISACLTALGLCLRSWPRLAGFEVYLGRSTKHLVASCPLLENANTLQKYVDDYLGTSMSLGLAKIILPNPGEEMDLGKFFGRESKRAQKEPGEKEA